MFVGEEKCRSFDCVSHDSAVRYFAQDDTFYIEVSLKKRFYREDSLKRRHF
jgi:hypothetical protein